MAKRKKKAKKGKKKGAVARKRKPTRKRSTPKPKKAAMVETVKVEQQPTAGTAPSSTSSLDGDDGD